MQIDEMCMSKNIACGTGSTYLINNEGILFVTGLNHKQQLGFSNDPDFSKKKSANFSKELFCQLQCSKLDVPYFKSIVSSYGSVLAITEDSRLFVWGNNQAWHLGVGETTEYDYDCRYVFKYFNLTHSLISIPKIKEVACGRDHSIALTVNGQILTCGNNNFGQLGVDFINLKCNTSIFVSVDMSFVGIEEEVTQVHAGSTVSAILTTKNKLFTWGDGNFLQLGYIPSPIIVYGKIQRKPRIVQMASGDSFEVKIISVGREHCCCVTLDNNVWSWGINTSGKLGNASSDNSVLPIKICSPEILKSNPIQISCGAKHTLLLTQNKSLWSTGAYKYGSGIYETEHATYHWVFKQIHIFDQHRKKIDIMACATGKSHSVLLTSENKIMTCGMMYVPVLLDTALSVLDNFGFGGLGIRKEIAQNSRGAGCSQLQQHVWKFTKVSSMPTDIIFSGTCFSMLTMSKIKNFLLGVYFDNVESAKQRTTDRFYMNALSAEMLDIIFKKILVS